MWRIHYDSSNVELFGDYQRQLEKADPAEASGDAADDSSPSGAPQPAYGRTKSGRKNVKQIQFGINVTRDGAVPVGLLPLDGNTAEVKTHLENLQLLDQVLPHSPLAYTVGRHQARFSREPVGHRGEQGHLTCGSSFGRFMSFD